MAPPAARDDEPRWQHRALRRRTDADHAVAVEGVDALRGRRGTRCRRGEAQVARAAREAAPGAGCVKTRLPVPAANCSVVAWRRATTTLQTNASNGSGIADCRYGTSFSHSLGGKRTRGGQSPLLRRPSAGWLRENFPSRLAARPSMCDLPGGRRRDVPPPLHRAPRSRPTPDRLGLSVLVHPYTGDAWAGHLARALDGRDSAAGCGRPRRRSPSLRSRARTAAPRRPRPSRTPGADSAPERCGRLRTATLA